MPPTPQAPLVHSTAAIISSGDELVLGQTLDTNSKWLSDRLTALGIRVVEHVTVGDDQPALAETISRLAQRVDVIIITGGLGPTADDLTRQALAQVMNEPLIEDPRGVEHLEKIARARGRTLHPMQRIQAHRPPSAALIDNPVGTAPGITAILSSPSAQAAGRKPQASCSLFALPGPPNELIPMFERGVLPALHPPAGRAITTLILHTMGLPESEIARRLGDLMKRDANPVVGTTASGGIVSCRIRYEGTRDAGELAIRDLEPRVRALMDPFVFAAGDQSLPGAVLELLRSRREKLVVVESCTGGLLGSLITAIPGSSDVFLGGWITYANEMKRNEVGVPPELLAQHGAVSEPVARAMATGALRAARSSGGASADHAIAITGVAGPDGGTPQKPVGDVFIAIASRTEGADIHSRVHRFRYPGDRNTIRDRAAKFALALLRLSIVTPAPPPLLWEVQLDATNWPGQTL